MANTKLRCVVCQQYYRRQLLLRQHAPVLCSVDCQLEYEKRARVKRQERQGRAQRRRHATPSLNGATRKRIRRRDGGRCRWCGAANGLEVHHIAYRSQGGPDADWNLITLCDDHHREVHANKRVWQPILRAVIWMHYVEGRTLTVPQVQRWLTLEAA